MMMRFMWSRFSRGGPGLSSHSIVRQQGPSSPVETAIGPPSALLLDRETAVAVAEHALPLGHELDADVRGLGDRRRRAAPPRLLLGRRPRSELAPRRIASGRARTTPRALAESIHVGPVVRVSPHIPSPR